jgi:3'(2'), 5'-bisphosphate nucleotidase
LGVNRSAVTPLGSVGLKCGRIAEGGADLYLHTSDKSYRWDACAPEAVLRAAGGTLTDLGGKPYRYDGTELRNLRGLLGCAPGVLERVLPVVEGMARQHGIL